MQQAQKIDYRELCRLENENYQLRQELDDWREKFDNLKKEQQIWEQIHRHNMISQQQQSLENSEQLSLIKEQFVAIVKQKQQQEQYIRELRQKVDDMKYTMQEMRQLSQKQERIHSREVEFFQMERQKYEKMLQDVRGQDSISGTNINVRERANNDASSNRIKGLLREMERNLTQANLKIEQLQDDLTQQKQANTKNEQKLQKCSQIAKEMQQYYTNELQSKQQLITQLQTELSKYTYHHQQSQNYYDLTSPHRKLPSMNTNEDCSSLKCSSIVSEYHHQQLLMANGENMFDDREFNKDKVRERLQERLQEKYKQMIEELKFIHTREVTTNHQKIRYLILKVQALQAQKLYLIKNTNLSHSQQNLAQSNLQFMQSFNQISTSNNCSKSLRTSHQQSVQLKMSKTSANDSFNICTPTHREEIAKDFGRQHSQSHHSNSREINTSGTRTKLTSVKTLNKSVQKSLILPGNRNSSSYQRVALKQNN